MSCRLHEGVIFGPKIVRHGASALYLLIVLIVVFCDTPVAVAAEHAPCVVIAEHVDRTSGGPNVSTAGELFEKRFRYARGEMVRWLSAGGLTTGECATVNSADKYVIRWKLSQPIRREQIARVGGEDWKREFTDYQSYVLEPQPDGVQIRARSGLGLIYGTYAFLEHQGFLWIDTKTTIIPNLVSQGLRLADRVHGVPNILLRGLWGAPPSHRVDRNYIEWMVRNRLNLLGGEPSAQSRMLGIWPWLGDHRSLQDAFSSTSLYAKHPDFYSIVNGRRRPVAATGSYFNPKFANPSAAGHFANWLLDRYSDQACSGGGPMLVNVWPADNRAERFDETRSSREIGNHSDNLLYFDGNVLDYLDKQEKCRLALAGISYYSTWSVPTQASLVKRLEQLPYIHIFYLNERTFSSPLGVGRNAEYARRMAAWNKKGLENAGAVDYINYSIFGTIALTNYLNYPSDLYFYAKNASTLYAYMHPIRGSEEGPRRLSNLLVSHLTWLDPQDEGLYHKATQVLEGRYFRAVYGTESEQAREIYRLFEESLDNAQVMFGERSLSRLLFQGLLWAHPPYSSDEVLRWIPAYLKGGDVSIPRRIPPFEEGPRSGSLKIRGLMDSLALQARAEVLARQLTRKGPIAGANMAAVRNDLAWYRLTSDTYRLLYAVANFSLSKTQGDKAAAGAWKSNALRYAGEIKRSALINVNLDGVKQDNFIKRCEKLLDEKVD